MTEAISTVATVFVPDAPKPKRGLTLVMIVKNESKIIERCLSSVKDIVDSIVISDTGSTDNTVELIHSFIAANNLDGTVYVDEWKHFGHNRTKSITNAQDWLQKNNYDLTKQYLLTIDADMIFKIRPEYKASKLLEKDSWLLEQVNPSMRYYNKRIFRSSLPYRCIGVTHEYWGCDSHSTEDKMSELFIDDIGDGGAKGDKFERDIRLLSQGVIDEPNNERYYFYLAQSYSDAGQKDEAIKWYKKRIEAGGWFEEVFMAHLRIGDIYQGMEEHEKAIHYWSLGYEYLPSRAETLFRIINYFRNKGKNHMALLYLKTDLNITYPNDQVLFIEYPVYKYKLLEELSISGYYTKDRQEAFVACDYLILSNSIPENVKNQCMTNLFFYMPKINGDHQRLNVETAHPYVSSVASLFKSKKGYVGNVRAVNYSLNKQFQYTMRDPENHVRTANYWVVFDTDDKGVLSLRKKYEVTIGPEAKLAKKRDSHIHGMEDMRLARMPNGSYVGLAVDWEYGHHNHPSVCLCLYDQDDGGKYYIASILPTDYKSGECQKNWCPFVDQNKLLAIYSHHPLTIVEIDLKSGHTTEFIKKSTTNKYDFDLGRFRGSTSPLRRSDGSWLVLIHEVIHRDTRKYYHRFVVYDKNWDIQQISLPFYFSEFFVEFSVSMVLDQETQKLSIFYSKEDNSTELLVVRIDQMKWMPVDIQKWCETTF